MQFRLASILAVVAALSVTFAFMSPYRTANLSDGQLNCPMGFVGSWELDETEQCMRIRLVNRTFSTKRLNLETEGIEATIRFKFDGYERIYYEKSFYMKLLTSDWLAAEIAFRPGASVDWVIPYSQFESHPIENRRDIQDISFAECVKVANPEVKSFWAFHYFTERNKMDND